MQNGTENLSMLDAIRHRRSVRTYADQPLNPEVRQKVEAILVDPGACPFDHTPRFALIERTKAHKEEKVKLGTYGFIKGAPYFIAGALTRGKMAEVDFGYLMERIVLEMTRLGLGTCWLGGTFSRKEYAQVLRLDDRSWVPAILALGVPAKRKGTVERLIRWGAKANNRKTFAELFFNRDFTHPLSRERAGEYVEVLDMVRIGPSASNKQPWRIVVDGEHLHLYLARTPRYRRLVPSTDLQLIDMGIAMQHLEAAAKIVGLSGDWTMDSPADIHSGEAAYIATWKAT